MASEASYVAPNDSLPVSSKQVSQVAHGANGEQQTEGQADVEMKESDDADLNDGSGAEEPEEESESEDEELDDDAKELIATTNKASV